ncbi:hypothetical protein HanIR_Chr04g0182931 [Helianthus annuus]|nr:hypothetical protein HanIR_Chr04g0182931 [Helianthus annuus]
MAMLFPLSKIWSSLVIRRPSGVISLQRIHDIEHKTARCVSQTIVMWFTIHLYLSDAAGQNQRTNK